MTTTHTLTGDIGSIISGTEIRSAEATIRTNLTGADAALVDLDNDVVAMRGPERITLAADGTFSIVLIATNSMGINVTDDSLRYTVDVRWKDALGQKQSWTSGGFELTADADLSSKAGSASALPTTPAPSPSLIDGPTAANIDDPGSETYQALEDLISGGGVGVPSTRLISAGTGMTGGGDLSADRTLTLDSEFVRDLIAGFVVAGASITVTHDDVGNTLTIAATGLASATGGGREASAALSATTGTATGNLANASVFTITPTGNFTLALSNVPASGTACTVTVIISQGATPYTLTMPSGTTWLQTAPTQAANKKCVVTLLTVDGGTTWLATAAVQP